MSIGRLIVEFEARTGKFETDTGRAAKIMEKRSREIDAHVRKIGVAVGAAIGAAAVGIGVLVKKSIDAADEMSKLAQSTGVAIGTLSQLQYAAGLSGVEDLSGSLTKFNRNIAEAARGTEIQEEAFKALGISVKNADGSLKDTETIFGEVAEAFSGIEDGAAKTAVAMDLFGRAGANLIPLLNSGKAGIAAMRQEADQLGLTLDERTGKAAEGFNDNLSRLGTVAQGIGTRLATEFAPELERLTGLLVDTAKETDSVGRSASGIATVIKGATLGFIGLANAVQIVAKSIAGLAAVNVEFYSGNFRGAVAAGKAALSDIRNDIADTGRAYERLFGAAVPLFSAPQTPEGGKRALTIRNKGDEEAARKAGVEAQKALQKVLDAEEKQRESIASIIDALKEEAATMSATNGQIQARAVAKLGGTAAEQQQAKALGDYVDQLKKAEESDKERLRVIESVRTPLEEYAAEVSRLNELFDSGKKDSEAYNRAIAGAQKAFEDAEKKAKESTDKMSVFADQAARNMQDAFADFLFNPFDQGVKGMVRSFAQALQRMAAEALAAGIFDKLLGSKAGGGLNVGSLAGLFSGSAGGSGIGGIGDYFSAMFGGFFAGGGDPPVGKLSMVGERGPELFVPKSAGTIVPNDLLGGKQQNIRIVNAFDTNVIADYMNSSAGEETFLNLARRNGTKLRNYVAS